MPKNAMDEWLTHHATMFGFFSDQHADMLLLWCDEFQRDGYDPLELRAATQKIAQNPPKFLTDHLALIRQIVRQGRLSQRETAPQRREGKPECMLCGGFGRVEVPQAGTLTLGGSRIAEDSLRMVHVYCRCPLGIWQFRNHCDWVDKAGSKEEKYRGIRPMNLDGYEKEYPDWRRLVTEIKARIEARRRSEDAAQYSDRKHGALSGTVGEIIGRAKIRYREPGQSA